MYTFLIHCIYNELYFFACKLFIDQSCEPLGFFFIPYTDYKRDRYQGVVETLYCIVYT
jgi:hypothetical protein